MKNTINPEEIQKFSALSDQWWDKKGPFKALHDFNPCRIDYILQQINQHIATHFNTKTYHDLSLLDIGCGGGLIAEPMAELGLNVTAIDAAEKNVKIAQHHASKNNVTNINYMHSSIEELITTSSTKYDIILALEIIEHVDNPEIFIEHIAKVMNQDSLLFISTINRNLLSLVCAKFMAEYVLNILPRGTHQFKKFIKPSEIFEYISPYDLQIKKLSGFSYNPITKKWKISEKLHMNYIAVIQKK